MSTEIKIFQLALSKLIDEVEILKEQNKNLQQDVNELKALQLEMKVSENEEVIPETELLNTKEVQEILGVYYNTLQNNARIKN